jgi:LuxR family transcriptional regulator, quorum-sensing system regulator CviR
MAAPLAELGRDDLLFLLETSYATISLNNQAQLCALLGRIGAAVPARGVVGTVFEPKLVHDPALGLAETRRKLVVENFETDAYSGEWLDEYERNNYFTIDPTKRVMLREARCFRWSDAFRAATADGPQRYIRRAREHGIDDGVTVSSRRESSGAIVFLAFLGAELAVARRHAAMLGYLAPFLHEAMYAAAGPAADRDQVIGALTEREAEALRWATAGKTNWEISMILSISERTVKFHVQNAMAKLGASSRAHAVAIAMRRELIAP